jgi:hypothetical protein
MGSVARTHRCDSSINPFFRAQELNSSTILHAPQLDLVSARKTESEMEWCVLIPASRLRDWLSP